MEHWQSKCTYMGRTSMYKLQGAVQGFQFHNVLPLLSHIQCQTSHPKTTEQILHPPQPIWKPQVLLLVFCKRLLPAAFSQICSKGGSQTRAIFEPPGFVSTLTPHHWNLCQTFLNPSPHTDPRHCVTLSQCLHAYPQQSWVWKSPSAEGI